MSHMDLNHFPPEIQEKIERLFDILNRIYSVPFLSKRLAFWWYLSELRPYRKVSPFEP